MALETLATPTSPTITTVEPSRAWILGLVVESDGSVSGPGSEPASEWPSPERSHAEQTGRHPLDTYGIDHDNA